VLADRAFKALLLTAQSPEGKAMSRESSLFRIEQEDSILFLTPTRDLSELEYSFFDAGIRAVVDACDARDTHSVVLDFSDTDYYGSTALGFFLILWKRIRSRDGRMAFCHVSQHEREVLELTKLDGLWPICATRAEAIAAIGR